MNAHDAQPCPGSCNRPHRADPANVPAVPGAPIWCDACVTRIRHALHELIRLYARLELNKRRGTRDQGSDRIRGGGDSRPSPSSAADDQDALVRLLTYWEDAIREALDLPWRRAQLAAGVRRWPVSWCRIIHGPARAGEPWPIVRTFTITHEELLPGPQSAEAATVDAADRFLRRHLPAALRHEGHAVELGNDLLRTADRLLRVTKSGAQRSRMPVPCPRCELRTLVHEGGSPYVICRNEKYQPPGAPAARPCRRMLDMDEYDELAARVAKSHAASA